MPVSYPDDDINCTSVRLPPAAAEVGVIVGVMVGVMVGVIVVVGVMVGVPTFADGLRAAQLTEAVLESARTGKWVEIK